MCRAMGVLMTLIIAFLLMHHMDVSPLAYVAVFVVWIIHLVWHQEGLGL